MELIQVLLDYILHMDVHLNQMAVYFGPWLYAVLFLIVFCETGLVVTPFLPGDSLLFAVGALAAVDGSPLNLWLLAALLVAAGVIGDAVNYSLGRQFGLRLFRGTESRVFNRRHLLRTQHFYERHGGKTIILARFLPIVRTFAPFVAGMGEMRYRRFAVYNVVGALAWVLLFLVAGFHFGNLPVVKRNFHIVIFAIIIISAIPVMVEMVRARFGVRQEGHS